MSSGIFGATIVNLTNGTTANAPDVLNSLNSLQSNGVNNDGGTITTNGSGVMTLVGLVTGASLLSLTSSSQSFNGSTSGTLTIYEFFTGSGLKIVLCYWNNYKNAGSAHSFTLNTAFSTFGLVINLGGNGLQFFNGASQNTNQIITALASGGGTSTPNSQVNQWCIAQTPAFTKITEPGGNGSAATALTVIIGF